MTDIHLLLINLKHVLPLLSTWSRVLQKATVLQQVKKFPA